MARSDGLIGLPDAVPRGQAAACYFTSSVVGLAAASISGS